MTKTAKLDVIVLAFTMSLGLFATISAVAFR